MTHVAEHNCEQKGKRNDRERCRVDFAVVGYAVSVYDVLVGKCKLVRAVKCGWCLLGIYVAQNGAVV